MIWRFRDFELDDVRFELRRAGRRVPIAPKPLALLLHLAKRHPAAVSRQELFRALWPGVRVTGASLARAVRSARRAIGVSGDDESVIRTIRGRGYAFGDSYVRDVPATSAPGVFFNAPFVGRGAELARIEAVLDNVEVGHGRLLLVSGEPGIGKSRFVGELASRAHAHRAVVALGHCREDDGAPPLWPWPEIVSGLLAECVDIQSRTVLERLKLELAPPRPEPLRAAGIGSGATDAEARFRLFHDVTQALLQAAKRRMIVVLIEDLHWARADALHLLRFAGRSLSKASVLIALTYRSAGPRPSPALEATVAELSVLSNALPPLQLTGLSEGELAAHVRDITGHPADPDLVRRVQDATGGNPLFLREIVPILTAWGGAGEPRERLAVPPSVTHVLRAQVGQLTAPARELVEIASVAGHAFAPQLLARVSGQRLESVLERLDEARTEKLIERDRSGRFRFRHGIVRAALREGVPAARRLDIHGRVAKAIAAEGDASRTIR
jgi:predicted ATPase/DNA-binding winged helix-turn-helix (wHTH) protein